MGEAEGDESGSSVASAGDVDGDGLDDLLMGAWGNNEGGADAGKTYLMMGSTVAAGITTGSASWDVGQADASFVGQYGDDYSGSSVASAGDVDGDGLDDLVIGASQNDEGGSNSGKTYLVLGQ